MTNYNHLLEEQRKVIQFMVDNEYSFTSIGKAIDKHRTTIYSEIQRNRYIKSNFFEMFDKKGINKAVNDCSKLQKKPYVCNSCSNKFKCTKHKLYYNSKIAQTRYEKTLKSSREGIDISPKTVEDIETIIVPLIKNKKHSINMVYTNHSDILYFSKPTFYKYVDLGVLSLCNLDLPKKVCYKTRKDDKDKRHKRELALLKGRTYKEYLDFTSKHPNMNVSQIDTVEGRSGSAKVLLTIIIKKTRFMLIFLLDKQTMACVTEVFNDLKEKLGIKLFAKIFRISLTDNGHEFFNPLAIELDYATGRKICNLFYCDPYSSWQKGTIEKNHEYIRKVYPKANDKLSLKGTSFDNLTEDIIKRLEDNINNIPREELDNKTPYELTNKLYPELIAKLNCSYVAPDDVDLSEEKYKGESNDK